MFSTRDPIWTALWTLTFELILKQKAELIGTYTVWPAIVPEGADSRSRVPKQHPPTPPVGLDSAATSAIKSEFSFGYCCDFQIRSFCLTWYFGASLSRHTERKHRFYITDKIKSVRWFISGQDRGKVRRKASAGGEAWTKVWWGIGVQWGSSMKCRRALWRDY